LMFVHSGALAGNFSFQVTDGWNPTPRQVFRVTARVLLISLEGKRGLSIFPGSTKPLSSHDLQAVTNDDNPGNRTVTFTIVRSPRLGRLLRINPDNCTEDASVFTQDLVNGGRILYQHVDLENTGWTAEDCFTFTVSSAPAVLGPEEFCVTISYEINEPGRQSRLLANAGAAVQEGDKVLIDQSKLDASNLLFQLTEPQRPSYEIWFQVTSLPRHGTILVGERNVTPGKPNFSQDVVNKFGITYLHDDSESLADHFTFVVWPNAKSKSPSKPETGFLEEMFNITITPVNDQAPELKTKGLRLKVLQGSKAVVGPEILKVEDLDSPPSEITYTIIRQPQNGFLAMAHEPQTPAQHFTQADVDNCRVWFLQDGSPSSGAFYFSATDGKHRPLYKLFRLDVIPISITLVNLTDLLIPQGDTTVPITNAHLSAVTSGNSSQITYRITWPLQHGHLLMENRAVTSFGQEDVDSGRLSYHMTDLTASEDRLQLSLSTSHANLTGQTLRVRVQPLLQVTSDLRLSYSEAHQLRRKDLDATALANVTQSDPTFEVTTPPAHGRLGRRAVDSCGIEEVTVFTQRDIDQGLLVLEPHAVNLTGTDPVSDSFSFLLRADRVQPATGSLSFTIMPPDPSLLPALTPGVPLSATGQNPVTSVFSRGKAMAASGHTAHVDTTQTRWLGENARGQQRGKGLHGDGKVSPTSVAWPQAATQVSPGGPFELSESSGYSLAVLIPLTAGSLLLVVTAVALCVWLLGWKKDKPRPLIKPQTSLEPRSPSCRPERSVAIPTVTVTPLLRSPSSSSPSVFR
uniref:Chondroitin sulfate proteoglycan 4 n=1 Tax=Jaculus jaculus TaxID=51337 RepID=A0A8C5K356_JACJA